MVCYKANAVKTIKELVAIKYFTIWLVLKIEIVKSAASA